MGCCWPAAVGQPFSSKICSSHTTTAKLLFPPTSPLLPAFKICNNSSCSRAFPSAQASTERRRAETVGIEKRVSRIGAHSWQGLIRRRTSRISKWVSVEKLSASGSGRDSNWQTAEGAKGYVRSKREEGLREAGASVSGSPALGSVENSDTDPISNQNPNPNPVQSGFARHADSATQLLEAVRLGRPLDWESRRSWNGMQKGVSGAGVRSQANPVAGEASTSGGAVGEPAGLPNRAPVGYELVMRGTKKPPGGSPILGRSKLGTSQPLDYRNASASMQNESPEGEGVSAEARGPAEASLSSAVSALNLNPAPNPVVNRVPRPDAIANPARNQVLNPASNPVRRKWEELLPETPKLLKPDTKPQKSLAAVTPALSSAAEKQEDSRRKWERELAPPPAGPPPPPPQKIQKSRLAAILSGESNAPERDSSSQGDGSERGLLRGGGGSWEDSPPPRQGLHFFKDGIEFTEVDPEVKERQIAEWLSQSGVAGRRRGEESLTGGESRFGDGFGTGFESGSESGSEGNSEKSSLRKWRVSQNGFAGAQRGVENGPSPGNGEPESGFSPRSRSGSHKNPGAEFRDERPQTRRQYGQAGRGPSLDFRGEAVSGLEENARIERPGERRRAGPSESGLSPGSRRDPESESNKVNREMGAERRRQSEPSESRSSRGSIDGLASGPLEEYRGEGVASPRQPRRLESGFRRRVDSNAEGIFEGDGLGGKQTGESRRSGPGSGQWESDSWQGLAMEVDEESSASGPSQEAHKRRARGYHSHRDRVPTVEVDRDSWLLGGPRPNSTRREDDAPNEPGYPANPDLEDQVVEEVSDLLGGQDFVRVRLPRQDDNPVDVADLHQAIMQRDFSRIWWLVEQKGADVNQLDDRILGYYTTALHVACEIGDPTMVIRLIENGARADIPDEFGRFPIVSALIGKEGYVTKMAVIEALLQTGVGVQQRNPINGKLPIHYSVIGPSDIIVYLKSKGANLDGKDFEGRTALHDALDIQDPNDPAFRNVEYLLGLGARPNVVDKQGKTPLHIAAERHEYVRCKELLRWKANVNTRDRSGRTPMRYVRPQPYGEDSIISLFQRFRGHL